MVLKTKLANLYITIILNYQTSVSAETDIADDTSNKLMMGGSFDTKLRRSQSTGTSHIPHITYFFLLIRQELNA